MSTVTYPERYVNSDPYWGENFLFADLETGAYVLGVEGRPVRASDAIQVTADAPARVTIVR
jgi:hypothetical protein